MSIIAEIAQRADVSVEGVMRVLTREPVSEDIKERVLAVIPELSPEQTRLLQRFALAALHDELPRPEAGSTDVLPASASAEIESRLAPVLEELVEAIKDLREEANAERRERVDDLALLVDVITTGWQGLDRRLGRVERVVGRIEPSGSTPPPPPPALVERPPPPQISAPRPLEDVQHIESPGRRSMRRWPVAAALVAGLGIGLLAGLDVLPARTDLLDRVSEGEGTTAGSKTANTATAPSRTTTPARTRPAATTTPAAATTSKQSGTPRTAPKPAPKPAPTPAVDSVLGAVTPAPKSKPPGSTVTAPASTTAQTRPPAGFKPTRKWGWGPIDGADYYVVEFFRAGKPFYRATPNVASLQLPDSVVFRPGAYRWVVRPGFGKPAQRRFGASVIDSTFEVVR